jgi:hypothetical protein
MTAKALYLYQHSAHTETDFDEAFELELLKRREEEDRAREARRRQRTGSIVGIQMNGGGDPDSLENSLTDSPSSSYEGNGTKGRHRDRATPPLMRDSEAQVSPRGPIGSLTCPRPQLVFQAGTHIPLLRRDNSFLPQPRSHAGKQVCDGIGGAVHTYFDTPLRLQRFVSRQSPTRASSNPLQSQSEELPLIMAKHDRANSPTTPTHSNASIASTRRSERKKERRPRGVSPEDISWTLPSDPGPKKLASPPPGNENQTNLSADRQAQQFASTLASLAKLSDTELYYKTTQLLRRPELLHAKDISQILEVERLTQQKLDARKQARIEESLKGAPKVAMVPKEDTKLLTYKPARSKSPASSSPYGEKASVAGGTVTPTMSRLVTAVLTRDFKLYQENRRRMKSVDDLIKLQPYHR